jgi:hypothetical protein
MFVVFGNEYLSCGAVADGLVEVEKVRLTDGLRLEKVLVLYNCQVQDEQRTLWALGICADSKYFTGTHCCAVLGRLSNQNSVNRAQTLQSARVQGRACSLQPWL